MKNNQAIPFNKENFNQIFSFAFVLMIVISIPSALIADYFKIPLDDRTINYDIYTNKGLKTNKKLQEYNSENTNILNLKQTVEVIKKANII